MLKLVMYVFIYKLIKEIKVGFFILKNYVICLNVKKNCFVVILLFLFVIVRFF